MTGRGVRLVAAVCLGLSLLVFGIQAAWEAQDGLAFPDHHSPNYLGNALICTEWWQLVARDLAGSRPAGTSPAFTQFPATGDYPAGTFLVSGLAMVLFGATVGVARLAQVLFIAGAIAAMAWAGWQVAGRRGAVLMALGMATTTWTAHYLRVYCMAPGLMFAVALLLALTMDSRSLTWTRRLVPLGLVFGLGMLIKYSVVLLGVPFVVLAALPRLWSTRRSRLGLLLLVVLLDVVIVLTWWGIESFRAGVGAGGLQIGGWSLILVAQALFTLALLAALRLGEEGQAGRGLLLVAALCGLVCGPWYFSRMDLWSFLIPMQYSFAPVVTAGGGQHPASWTTTLSGGLYVVSTFYWAAPVWLAVGGVALLSWKARFRKALYLVATSLVVLALHVGLLIPDPRYLAPTTPVLVVLAFLWAARWRSTFVACAAFMLLAGFLQTAAWLPMARQVAANLGLELVPVSRLLPGSKPPNPHVRPAVVDVRRVPVAELPSLGPSILEAVPAGARVGILWLDETQTFFLRYLGARARVVEVAPGAIPRDLEYLLLYAHEPPPADWRTRQGIVTPPRRFRVVISNDARYLDLYRLGPQTRGGDATPDLSEGRVDLTGS